MTTPNFICIGAQKAGTTWLHSMLSEHPEIWLGPFKEYQFFNTLFVPEHAAWTRWHINNSIQNALRFHCSKEQKINLNYVRFLSDISDPESMFTEEWYRKIFSFRKGKISGDITPEYCTIPEEGIDYFFRTVGSIPVVYLIRNPATRALSQLKMNISRGHLGMPGNPAAWREAIAGWDIQNRGDYKTYVARWESRFPRSRLLFLPYGDVATRPIELLRSVEKHIGVSPHEYSRPRAVVHEGKSVDVPSYVKELLAEAFEPQAEFLRQRFGAEFLQRT